MIRTDRRVEDAQGVTSSTTSPSTAWASCCTVSKLCKFSSNLVCNSWVSFCRKATSCCSAALLAAATFLICAPQCTVRTFAAAEQNCVISLRNLVEMTNMGHETTWSVIHGCGSLLHAAEALQWKETCKECKSTALIFSSEHHITPLCLGGLLHLSFIQVAKHELENQHQGS